MKKLIVVLMLVAFALAPAVQAGEGKDSAKSKAKTANADKAKTAECADAAKSDCADKSAQTACATACCEKNNLTKKTAKPAEKGGMLLAKR